MSGETPHDRRDVDGRADVEITAEDDGGLGEEEVEARVGLSYTLVQLRRDPTALAGLAIISVSTTVAIIASIDAVLLDYWFAQTYWYHPELGPHADTRWRAEDRLSAHHGDDAGVRPGVRPWGHRD